MTYINWEQEHQILNKARTYEDAEAILCDICDRLRIPDDIYSKSEIINWLYAHKSEDAVTFFQTLYTKISKLA